MLDAQNYAFQESLKEGPRLPYGRLTRMRSRSGKHSCIWIATRSIHGLLP